MGRGFEWEKSEPARRSGCLEYEARTRIHARGLAGTLAEALRILLARLPRLEMARPVLARALVAVRTLDALHLASVEFLRAQGQSVVLASYDAHMLEAAVRMDVALLDKP